MFDDILGNIKPPENIDYKGCPYCGEINIEEDGIGSFIGNEQYNQPMVCNTCGGRWTVEYDEDLEVKKVDY